MTQQKKISNKDNERKPRPIPTREEWHRTYGGNVASVDFNEHNFTMGDVAHDIISDFKFDRMCMINWRFRQRCKNSKKGDSENERV